MFDNNTDFFYNFQNLFKVTNNGQDWEALSLTPQDGVKRSILTLGMWANENGLAGCREENGKAYVHNSVYLRDFYRTNDFGNTWEVLDFVTPDMDHTIYRFLYAEGIRFSLMRLKGFGILWIIDLRFLKIMETRGLSWNCPFTPKKCNL